MTANHENHDQALPAEPIVTYERPLTPKEAAGLGLSPGPSFAEGVKAAMSKEPDIIIYGAVPPQITQEERDRAAARPYIIRHHTRRFALYFAIFAVVLAANIVMMILGVHGLPAFTALVGIIMTVPAFLYHEVKAVRAGGTLEDLFSIVSGVFHKKARSSNG
jgi:hypothetical protein